MLLSWLKVIGQDIREEEVFLLEKIAKVCMGLLLRLMTENQDVMHREKYQEANQKTSTVRLKAEQRY